MERWSVLFAPVGLSTCWLVLASACGASSGGVGPLDATADRDDGSSSDDGIEGGDATGDGDASHSGDVQMDSESGDGGFVPDALREADAPECPPDDPTPPVIASTSTITFVVTNTSGSDRWLLTNSTDCEAFSINGVVTELPSQTACGDFYPPEDLYFQRLATSTSATLTWDARGLVPYTTYQSCSNTPSCASTSNGSPQPVSPGQYVAQFAVASVLATGSGTPCSGMSNGDVTCSVSVPTGNPQHGGQCTYASLIQQTFTVPSSGDVTVNVPVP